MTMDFYQPKPAKFQGDEKTLECIRKLTDNYKAGTLIRGLLATVAYQVLQSRYGLAFESRNWARDIDTPLQKDPWHVSYYQREFDSYSYDQAGLREFIGQAELGRKLGLWTCHNASTGKSVPFPVKGGEVRINPLAWETLQATVFQQNPELTKGCPVSMEHAGWYEVRNGSDRSFSPYYLRGVSNGTLEMRAVPALNHRGAETGVNKLIFKQAGVSESRYKVFMSVLLRMYSWDCLPRFKEASEGLFPHVPSRALVETYYAPTEAHNLYRNVGKAKERYLEALASYRTARADERMVNKAGGYQGLLEAMGKDLHMELLDKAPMWAAADEDTGGHVLLMRSLAESFLQGEMDYLLKG